MVRESPLLTYYVDKLKAEVGEFAGWNVPMKFTNSIEEHLNTRRDVSFFDVTHMGRIFLKGADVSEFLELIYTKRVSETKQGFMSGPTLALNEYARVKDDEMLYRLSDEEWFVVVNAEAREKMINYYRSIIEKRRFRVSVEDLTASVVMIAVQGPRSVDVLNKLGFRDAQHLKPLEFRLNVDVSGISLFLVSRSGWTGEDGFEIWLKPGDALNLVNKLLELNVKPAGLIARDTLRMEMGFVLYGHEYGEDPVKYPCALALRYGFKAIDWSKRGFIGEDALRSCRRNGVDHLRVGLKLSKSAGRAIPRHGCRVYVEDVEIGWVTSGAYSPVLDRGIAQAYVKSGYALLGEEVNVEIRGKMFEAKIVDFPFIEKK